MNWFFMVLSAAAGGLVTWLLSLRKVTRKVPTYGSVNPPATTTTDEPATAAPLVGAVTPEDGVAPEATVESAAPSPAETPVLASELIDTQRLEAETVAADAPSSTVEGGVVTAPEASSSADAVPTQESSAPAAKPAPASLASRAGARGARSRASRESSPTLLSEPAPERVAEPHGAGSATPAADGSGPAGWSIKGNAGSMLFHTTQSPYFKRTKAEAWFETEAAAEAAGFTRWDKRDRKTAAPAPAADAPAPEAMLPLDGPADPTTVPVVVPDGPYGPGSAAPGADGSGPDGWAIKGNAASMLFHTTESPYYKRTKAEAWFATEAAAEAAGFTKWAPRRK